MGGDWAAGIEVVPPWCCEPAKQFDRDASRRHRLSPRPWAGARRAESVDARRPAGRSSQDLSRRDTDMGVIDERCCGLDVHKRSVVACLIPPVPDSGRGRATRTFGTMSPDLLQLADWLQAAGCTH